MRKVSNCNQLYNSIFKSVYADVLNHFPAGVSKKMIFHLLKNIESGNLTDFDYFSYNLNKVSIPIVIYDREDPHSFIKFPVRRKQSIIVHHKNIKFYLLFQNYDRLQEKLLNVVINLINEDFEVLWPTARPGLFQDHVVDLLKNYQS